MLTLPAKTRQNLGKKVKILRKKGILPGVLYGPKMKNIPLEVDLEDFEKAYKEAGESSFIKLELTENKKKTTTRPPHPPTRQKASGSLEYLVLIHEVQRDPLTDKPLHVDFYQAPLEEEIEAKIPLVFEGEALAVKDLSGTLIKNISEVEVKALPQNLPKEIKVDISVLNSFEDNILVKDLKIGEGVKILKEPEETVAKVSPPEKVEEELEKPVEEKVEEVEVVEEKKEEEK